MPELGEGARSEAKELTVVSGEGGAKSCEAPAGQANQRIIAGLTGEESSRVGKRVGVGSAIKSMSQSSPSGPRVDHSNSTVSRIDLTIFSSLWMDVITGNGSGTNPLAGYDSVVGRGSHWWSVAGFLLLSRTLQSGMTSPVWSEQGDGCQRC